MRGLQGGIACQFARLSESSTVVSFMPDSESQATLAKTAHSIRSLTVKRSTVYDALLTELPETDQRRLNSKIPSTEFERCHHLFQG